MLIMHDTEDEVASRAMDGVDYLARLPLLVRWGRITNTLLTMAASGDTAYAMMSAAHFGANSDK